MSELEEYSDEDMLDQIEIPDKYLDTDLGSHEGIDFMTYLEKALEGKKGKD